MGKNLIWSLIHKTYQLLALSGTVLETKYILCTYRLFLHTLSLKKKLAGIFSIKGRFKYQKQDQRSLFKFNEVKIIYLKKLFPFKVAITMTAQKRKSITQYAFNEYCGYYGMDTQNNNSHSYNSRMRQLRLFSHSIDQEQVQRQ